MTRYTAPLIVDHTQLLQDLNRLVQIPSLDGTPEEVTAQAVVGEIMRRLGLDVTIWEIDFEALQAHPSFSAEVDRPRGLGVLGRFGPGNPSGRTLVLNGHIDVVPAGELDNWTVEPWSVSLDEATGKVFGRGALDMKGGLCCALYAIQAIQAAGIELDGEVIVQSVMGEEDGGSGTLAAVQYHLDHKIPADGAIIMEPTEMMIAPAQAGCFNFRVTIPGKAAHGAVRNEGVDPLEKFMLVYQSILSFEQARNRQVTHPMFQAYDLPYPICVGKIEAGVWASTVPEMLTFEGRYGVQIDEDPDAARQAFETLIAQVAAADPWLRENPPKIEWWGGQFYPAETAIDHPLVESLSAAFETTTGDPATLRGMTYGADMRLLILDGGIPTVMFGPGDVRKAHQPDEFVPLDDLIQVTETLARTIIDFCGVRTAD